jgi:hypothetical protein
MDTLGLILIALMGSNDFNTREVATHYFNKMAKDELLSYEVEMIAYNHKDLEIQHRAQLILNQYYGIINGNGQHTDEYGELTNFVDITRRSFVWYDFDNHPTQEFTELMDKKGWIRDTTFMPWYLPKSGYKASYFIRKPQ